MSSGKVRAIPSVAAKKNTLVHITDHTGADLKIFSHGIAAFNFFVTDNRYQLLRPKHAPTETL